MIILTIIILIILIGIFSYGGLYSYFLYTTKPCIIKNNVKGLKKLVYLQFENGKEKGMKHFIGIDKGNQIVDFTSTGLNGKFTENKRRQIINSYKKNFTYIVDILMIEELNNNGKIKNTIYLNLNKKEKYFLYLQKYFYNLIVKFTLFLLK